jgi:hypothetical protein
MPTSGDFYKVRISGGDQRKVQEIGETIAKSFVFARIDGHALKGQSGDWLLWLDVVLPNLEEKGET